MAPRINPTTVSHQADGKLCQSPEQQESRHQLIEEDDQAHFKTAGWLIQHPVCEFPLFVSEQHNIFIGVCVCVCVPALSQQCSDRLCGNRVCWSDEQGSHTHSAAGP